MTPGKASDHIRPLREVVRRGTKVVLWLRVSGRVQDRNRNLDVQEAVLRSAVERLGGVVTEVVRCVGSGSLDNDRWGHLAYKRWLASQLVKENDAEVIVATSTSRFVRSAVYHTKKRPGQLPTERDYQALAGAFAGLTLATLLRPDSSPAKERRRSIIWGRRVKRRNGLPEVKELYDQGLRGRPLARASGRAESTVRRWCATFLRDG